MDESKNMGRSPGLDKKPRNSCSEFLSLLHLDSDIKTARALGRLYFSLLETTLSQSSQRQPQQHHNTTMRIQHRKSGLWADDLISTSLIVIIMAITHNPKPSHPRTRPFSPIIKIILHQQKATMCVTHYISWPCGHEAPIPGGEECSRASMTRRGKISFFFLPLFTSDPHLIS